MKRVPGRIRLWVRSAAAVAAVLIIAAPAGAQYPARPIKLVVPFIAGSAPDALARQIGERIGVRLGQPVVIENRGGAGGNVGAEYVAKQPGDGYTLMLATSSHLVNPVLYSKVAYDPIKDFQHIALLIRMPALLVVPNDLPAKDVSELIALAKGRPGAMNYASGGNGSQAHLAGAMFRTQAGIDVVHIPYKGAPEIISALLANNAQIGFPTFSTALPQVKAGKLKALAVTSPRRNPLLVDVPTLSEAMPGGFDMEAWFGVWAPAGTPSDIVKKLNGEITAALSDPELRSRLAADGSEVATSGNSDDYSAYVKSDAANWARIVRASGAKVE